MEVNNLCSLKCCASSFITQRRLFFVSSLFRKKQNHYDILGVTPKATIADIKKAYYNLSMVYHPDRNDGSDQASQKFRAVTEAYRVLSNLKNRKLYDKGVGCTTPLKSEARPKPKNKTRYSPEESPVNIHYDFDKWSREHYGESVLKRAAAKERYGRIMADKEEDLKLEKVKVVTVSIILVISMYSIHYWINEDLDKPKVIDNTNK